MDLTGDVLQRHHVNKRKCRKKEQWDTAQKQPPVGQEHLKSRKTMLLLQSSLGFIRFWLFQRSAPLCPALEEQYNTGVWTIFPEYSYVSPHNWAF